jgi:hypothetical protein
MVYCEHFDRQGGPLRMGERSVPCFCQPCAVVAVSKGTRLSFDIAADDMISPRESADTMKLLVAPVLALALTGGL